MQLNDNEHNIWLQQTHTEVFKMSTSNTFYNISYQRAA